MPLIAGGASGRGLPPARHLASFATAYVLAGGLGQGLALIPGVAITFWPPAGIFVAALLLAPTRRWPWYVLAGCLAELACNVIWFRNPLPSALAYFGANALEALAAAWLVRRATGGRFRFESPAEVAAFVALAAGVAPIVGATGIALIDELRGKHPFASAWPLVWLGDASGLLVSAPLTFLAARAWRGRRRIARARIAEALAALCLLVVVAALAFRGRLPTAYACLPPVLWAAVRFQLRGAAAALALVTLAAAYFTATGEGEFAGGPGLRRERAVMLQAFLAITSASALVVAALSLQHRRALIGLRRANASLEARVAARTADLRRSEERLRLAMEASSTGLWGWDVGTDAVTWSPGCYRILGIAEGEFAGTGAAFFGLVHPDDRGRVESTVRAAVAGGTPYECEFRIVRPGGASRWVSNRGSATRDADGRATGMLGTITDVDERKRAEEQLRRNHDTFSHLVRNNPFGVYVVDADFRLREASLGARKVFENVRPLLGRDFAEVLREIWPGPFADEAIARFRHTLETGEPYSSPGTVQARRDIGAVEAYDWRIERVALPDGRPGVVCYFYDLSERRRWEAALAEGERRFRALADNMSQLAWMADGSGAISWYNRRWFEYTGTALEEMRGWGWRAVQHPDHVDRVVARISECFRTGEPWEDTFPLRGRDGGYRWFLSRAVPIRDESGSIALWFGTNTDITERAEAEAALKARERELRTLADNSPDAIARFDRDLRHIFVSAAAGRATGLKPEGFLGRTNRELGMSPDLCDRWEAALAEVFATGRPGSIDFDRDSPSGKRSYSARLVPEPGPDGAVGCVLAVTRDVTERVLYEAMLRDQDRKKDEFLAMLAHELRNPLSAIRAAVAVLRRIGGGPDADLEWGRDVIDRQAAQLTRLIDDLLDVSRITQGKIRLRREDVDIRDVVARAAEAVGPLIDARRHTLAIALPDSALPAFADPVRLGQVVGNLLANAAKYTDEGGSISVVAERDGDRAAIRVRDDGVGLTAEQLPRIFGLFAQVDASLDRSQGGLGIGLTLVKSLAELHGGSVAAASDGPGRGSEFTVLLPLSRRGGGPPPAASRAPAAAAPPRPVDPAGRVLVVDDNADTARGTARLLKLSGYEVAVAHDGPSALDAARGTVPRAVLLDIGLPGMDGYEVARTLRGSDLTRGVTLIAVSGYGREEDRARARESGFDHHLIKPVDFDRLLGLLADAGSPHREAEIRNPPPRAATDGPPASGMDSTGSARERT